MNFENVSFPTSHSPARVARPRDSATVSTVAKMSPPAMPTQERSVTRARLMAPPWRACSRRVLPPGRPLPGGSLLGADHLHGFAFSWHSRRPAPAVDRLSDSGEFRAQRVVDLD